VSNLSHRITPGQLWQWNFNASGDGTFYLELVNDARRTNAWAHADHVIIIRGEMLFVVSVNDKGPLTYNDMTNHDDDSSHEHSVWSQGYTYSGDLLSKWVVCLFNTKLVWLKNEWLTSCCELIGNS
jgi:hypothetical protein